MTEKLNELCSRVRETHQEFLKASAAERAAHTEWQNSEDPSAKRRVLYQKWSSLYSEKDIAQVDFENAKKVLCRAVIEDK